MNILSLFVAKSLNRRVFCIARLTFILLLTLASQSRTRADETAQDKLEFFEGSIRPLLVQRCVECHDRQGDTSGGLILSDRIGVRMGGDSGQAINLEEPTESLLLKAIGYEDPYLQMPPDSPLSKAEQALFQRWIEEGATDPREMPQTNAPASAPTALPLERSIEHWAYRSLVQPLVPNAKSLASRQSDETTLNEIDLFLEEKFSSALPAIANRADRPALMRRLTFDLHGLPPTLEQFERFAGADFSLSYQALVDDLLSSQSFGERFARHWMDIVRYADSLTLRGFVLEDAWRYRDYLIDSYNSDMRYDDFIREQVAGDLLALHVPATDFAERQRLQIASTFLLLGNTNLEEQDKSQLEMDIVDEQLDVIGKGILGQTLTCARCHDHKFDPIPTADYYAMAGILKSVQTVRHDNVSNWVRKPLPLSIEQESFYAELADRGALLKARIQELQDRINQKSNHQGPVSLDSLDGIVVDDARALKIGDWLNSTHTKPYVGSGYVHDQNREKGKASITFAPENILPGRYRVRLAYQSGDNRSKSVRVTIASADGEQYQVIDQSKVAPIENLWIELGSFNFEKDGQAYVLISNVDSQGHVIADAVQFIPVEADNLLNEPTATVDAKDTESLELETWRLQKSQSEAELKELNKQLDSRPTSLGLIQNSPVDLAVHVRGSVHTLGNVVPRGFLRLTNVNIPIAESSAGRIELANWLVHPQNPMTARVYVNRIWKHLMGQGLVASVDNFGTTGTAPTHPELLDYLASRFIQEGWSTKWLVRQIVNSQAYQRSSNLDAPTAYSKEDWQLAQQNYAVRFRKRLDAESVRDSLLLASQELELGSPKAKLVAGRANDFNATFDTNLRSVYLPVFRNSANPILSSFDVADSSSVVGDRNQTIVAAQALLFLNSPWIDQRITRIASDLVSKNGLMNDDKLDRLSVLVLGRHIRADEQQILLGYLEAGAGNSDTTMQRWKDVVKGLVGSIDFQYLP